MDVVLMHTMEREGIQPLLDASFLAVRQQARRVEIVQTPNRKRSYRVGAVARSADGKSPLYGSRYLDLGLFIDIYC